jgi:hypothetical protein
MARDGTRDVRISRATGGAAAAAVVPGATIRVAPMIAARAGMRGEVARVADTGDPTGASGAAGGVGAAAERTARAPIP